MKKRIFGFLCFLVLVVGLLYPSLASAEDYDVTSLASVTRINGDFYFHVLLDNSDISYSKANLTLAIYNAKGKLLDVQMQEITRDNTEKVFIVNENFDIATYKIMLLGADGQFTPICEPSEESVEYAEIEEKEPVKIIADDIKEVVDNKLIYYLPNDTKTLTIQFEEQVRFLLNNGLESDEDYDVFDLVNLSSDVQLLIIDIDNDSKYDTIIATWYNIHRITGIDAENGTIEIDKTKIRLNKSIKCVFENHNGNKLTLSDFEIDDIVAVVANADNIKNADYIKIINLSDNVIKGTVTAKATRNGRNYVWIGDVKHEDLCYLNIEDTGIFYVDMLGRIFDFKNIVKPNYAYILEAAKTQEMFSEDKWEVKLLTSNGVATYSFTEDADAHFDKYLKYEFGVSGDKWLFDDNAGVNPEARIITFKTNSNGEIRSFESVANCVQIEFDEYNASLKKIDGKLLSDDALIFDVYVGDADDAYAASLSCLIDENEYSGIGVKVDGEVELFVVVNGETTLYGGENLITDEYAYILGAYKDKWGWELELLTANGFEWYMLSPSASNRFDKYKEDLGIDDSVDSWEFEENCDDLANPYRIIKYTVNSYEELKLFSKAEEAVMLDWDIFRTKTKKIGNTQLYDDTVIFALDFIRNPHAMDVNGLIDGVEYEGICIKQDGKTELFVILESGDLPPHKGETVKILSDDIDDIYENELYYYVGSGFKTNTIRFEDKVTYILNNGLETSENFDIEDLWDLDYGIELQFIDSDKDSLYDTIIATEYYTMSVTGVDVENNKIGLEKTWIYLEDDSIECILEDNKGNKLNISDFEIDDIVAVVANDNMKNADYIKIINLSDNVIEGTVTETSRQNGKRYVWINGSKYEDFCDLDIEDTGIFYLDLFGRIIEFKSTVKPNYAYVLEAAKTSEAFSDDKWEVKLLTSDGVATYSFTEDADAHFDKYLKYEFGVSGDKWLFDDNAGVNPEARIITFKTNSNGEIRSFESVANCVQIEFDEYNASLKKIDGKLLSDDALIFDVYVGDADDAYAASLSCLIDENEYSGIGVKVDGEVELFVVVNGETTLYGGENLITDEYAYILGAYKDKWGWEIELLTANGFEWYMLSPSASNRFDKYKEDLGIDDSVDSWEFEENCDDLANPYRIIKYTVNSNEELKLFSKAEEEVMVEWDVFNSKTKKIGNIQLSDDTLIFGLDAGRKSYVIELNALIDGIEYEGISIKKDGKTELFVILESGDLSPHKGETVKILSDDIDDIYENELYYYVGSGFKTNTIRFEDKVTYILNNGLETSENFDIEDLWNLNYGVELQFIDSDKDSLYDTIIATEYYTMSVMGVDVENNKIRLEKTWIYLEDDSIECILEDNKGNKLNISDFEVEGVVAVVVNDDNIKNADYIRIIKLTDNIIEGVVTEKVVLSGREYVFINGKKYETFLYLEPEDAGVFYIDIFGRIIKFEANEKNNYAYILEAVKTSVMFSDDEWEVKLLTSDGVDAYSFTEYAAHEFNEYIEYFLGVYGNKWLFEDNRDSLDNLYRIITFKTNSDGEIKAFERVYGDLVFGEYNQKYKKIDGNMLVDDTLIFNVCVNKANDAYATDISYLIDEIEYAGSVVKVDNKVELFVIFDEGDPVPSDEVGFAIVTDVRETTVDGEDVLVISYIQDMTEGEVTFTEDSCLYKDATGYGFEELDIGDVFVFAADDNGNVLRYAVLATAGKNTFKVNEDNLTLFSEDNAFVYGYIASCENISRNNNYEAFEVGGIENKKGEALTLYVYDDANTYSFYETKRDIKINTEYIYGDADWYYDSGEDEYDDEATFFFARLIDDDLVDIYTMGIRVAGVDAIAKEAKNAIYYNVDPVEDAKYIDGKIPAALQDKLDAKVAEEAEFGR